VTTDEKDGWVKAVEEEHDHLAKNGVFTAVPVKNTQMELPLWIPLGSEKETQLGCEKEREW